MINGGPPPLYSNLDLPHHMTTYSIPFRYRCPGSDFVPYMRSPFKAHSDFGIFSTSVCWVLLDWRGLGVKCYPKSRYSSISANFNRPTCTCIVYVSLTVVWLHTQVICSQKMKCTTLCRQLHCVFLSVLSFHVYFSCVKPVILLVCRSYRCTGSIS